MYFIQNSSSPVIKFPSAARWSWSIDSKLCPSAKDSAMNLSVDTSKRTIQMTFAGSKIHNKSIQNYINLWANRTEIIEEYFDISDYNQRGKKLSVVRLSNICFKNIDTEIGYDGIVITNFDFFFNKFQFIHSPENIREHWSSPLITTDSVLDDLKKLLAELEQIPTSN